MCLVAIAWRAHPRYPLIIAGNRDEMHGRPAAPAAWWEDAPHVFGGRDLAAGGSWLAVSRAGRFAVVTNNPQRPPGPAPAPSRGQLVRDFVAGDRPSGRFMDSVQVNEARYAGFCLLAGTRVQVRGFVTPRGQHPGRWTLKAGITVVSNSALDHPWPKVRYMEAAMAGLLGDEQVEPERMLTLLARREPVGDADEEAQPVSRVPFLVGEQYGTRASTVVLMGADGACDFIERRFGPAGADQGEVRERFEIR